ncbi:MAG: hypothetical protein LBF40_07645, partial [Deltaproteobacteria bacterium]|nr:hypothetical protein [Deltaproteobacteria bacterium]
MTLALALTGPIRDGRPLAILRAPLAAFLSATLPLMLSLPLLLLSVPALAQDDLGSLFLKLPDSETNNLDPSQRQALLDTLKGSVGGYAAPSKAGFWLESFTPDVLTLFGIHHMPAVYKYFRGGSGGAGILAVCRSLQTSGPSAADERSEGSPPFDLTLYQAGAGRELVKVDQQDYIPPIGVLDFVTRDTLQDYYATKDLELINKHFRACLTCHASVGDPVALDILTITSISGHSCASFITQYKLLPLAWNGSHFEKPYDRAVSP